MKELEKRETEPLERGKVVGYLSPLINLYRTCQTQTSEEREAVVADVFGKVRQKHSNLGILIKGSLAFGTSIPSSDVDIDILLARDDYAALKALEGELRMRLPGVKSQVVSEIISFNVDIAEKTLSRLEEKPELSDIELCTDPGPTTLTIRDFCADLFFGGLYFGPPPEPLLERADEVAKLSPLLYLRLLEARQKGLQIDYYEKFLKERYLTRLKESERFQGLSTQAQEDLLGEIEETENRLRPTLWEPEPDFIRESIWHRLELGTEYYKLKLLAEAQGLRVVEVKSLEEIERLTGQTIPAETPGQKSLGAYLDETKTIFTVGVLGQHPVVLFEELYHWAQSRGYSTEVLLTPASEEQVQAFAHLCEMEARLLAAAYARSLNCPFFSAHLEKIALQQFLSFESLLPEEEKQAEVRQIWNRGRTVELLEKLLSPLGIKV